MGFEGERYRYASVNSLLRSLPEARRCLEYDKGLPRLNISYTVPAMPDGHAYDRRDEDELWHDLVFAATFSMMVILRQRLNGQSLSGYAWNRDALGMFVD